jgi:hypothetical protein
MITATLIKIKTMKKTNHKDRKSFAKWAQPNQKTGSITHPDHLPHHTTKTHVIPALMATKEMPRLPQRRLNRMTEKIMGLPGTMRDVLDLRDSRSNPRYRRSRDGGVRRIGSGLAEPKAKHRTLMPVVVGGEVIVAEKYSDQFRRDPAHMRHPSPDESI